MSNSSKTHQAAYSGTMVILPPQRAKAEALKSASVSDNSSRLRLSARASAVMSAAAIGSLAGALATVGILRWMVPEPVVPSYYSALAEALGRVDHELTALKSATESSAKAADQQMAKIAERLDRAEMAQAEAGAKADKAADSAEQMAHRLASVSGDITGAMADSRASTTAHQVSADSKQPPPTPVIDGWVVRDVYHGAALIQGHGGMIEVLPGDSLPGLGRIQQVRRQDGRWVVITSRGQIVSR